MPTLGNALDFAKYEGRSFRAHQLGVAPSSPVTGQLYYNTADNTLYWWDGTQWVPAKAGAGTPSGPAGGDLSGTYPNPQIAAGVVTDVDVSAANKDGAVATPSLRTLGAGAQQAMPGNRTLDAIPAPVANLSLNSKLITSLANGVAATDAVNKGQLDSVVSGLDVKASCRVATTAALTLTAPGVAIDGVTLANGERVLVKNQAAGAENGIYVFNGSAATMTRAADADTSAEVTAGMFTFVSEGTANADSGWYLTTNNPITLGTTALTFVQFSGAGQIISGAGLTKNGNTLDVGAAAGITVAADTVGVATGGVTNAMLAGAIDVTTKLTGAVPVANGGTSQTTAKAARETGLVAAGYYSSATHGAGTTITITAATHLLRATRGIQVQVQDEATGAVEIPDIVVAANGDVTVTYGTALVANSKRVTLVG